MIVKGKECTVIFKLKGLGYSLEVKVRVKG